jgi:hypothetical protein
MISREIVVPFFPLSLCCSGDDGSRCGDVMGRSGTPPTREVLRWRILKKMGNPREIGRAISTIMLFAVFQIPAVELFSYILQLDIHYLSALEVPSR